MTDRTKRAAELRRRLTVEIRAYRLMWKHERTPRTARWLLGAAIAYALTPIDLIPDGIPVIGQLDDLLVVPGLIWLALRLVPEDVIRQCRAEAESRQDRRHSGRNGGEVGRG